MFDPSATYFAFQPASLLEVTGADRVDLLHRLCTNTLQPLKQPNHIVQTLFTTQQGRLIDWVQVWSHPQKLWLLTSPSRAARLREWIVRYTIVEDVTVQDESAHYVSATLLGPQAAAMAGLTATPPAKTWVLADDVAWSTALGAYGPGLVAVLPAAAAEGLRHRLQDQGGREAEADTMELLRLHAGVPSPAAEFAEEVNPLELRLTAHAVGWNKGCYIGQEVISRLDSYDKVARLLTGFDCPIALPLGQDYKLSHGGRPQGRVTSLAHGGPGTVGLAIVKREVAEQPGLVLDVTDVPGAQVVLRDRPFFKA